MKIKNFDTEQEAKEWITRNIRGKYRLWFDKLTKVWVLQFGYSG